MGRRSRRRSREQLVSAGAASTTTEYRDEGGNLLILRDSLSPGTLRSLEKLDAKPAASAEDRWQRRVELLFERLVVRWDIAGLPLEGQKELLGRYRMADSGTRTWLRETLERHVGERHPDAAL
jgi:hypothetical protein